VWFFLTPVIYNLGALSQRSSFDVAEVLLVINPMAAIITMYRQVLLSGVLPDPYLVIRTLLICAMVWLLGVFVFVRNSDRIGDDL
jgi:ABC-type polysaccharide/polyol phosphate export permease